MNTIGLAKLPTHPLRIQILDHLWEVEVASPSDVAKALKAPLGNVSYHMRMMAEWGAIKMTHKKPRRGAIEHYYKPLVRAQVVLTNEEAWMEQVQKVVDQAHAEDLGGKHRSGFCEACADAYLVAQRAVPGGPDPS